MQVPTFSRTALQDVLRDVRFTIRSLTRHKSFAAATIATLGLTIGATTAVFSLVNGVILKPLPFAQPDRLVQIYGTPAFRGDAVAGLATIRAQSRSFDALVGYNVSARYLQSPEGRQRLMAVTAEREFFSMLGSVALEGRVFRSDDPPTVVVISEAFWKRVLGGRPAIGTTLAVDDAALTVVGIMPDSFQFPYGAASVLHSVAPQTRTDVWIPSDPPLDSALGGGRFGYVTGRLKPDVSLEQAASELDVIARRMEADDPQAYRGRGLRVEPLKRVVVASSVRQSLTLLFVAVFVVLAVAAMNVASLLLVRSTLRGREMATRVALGAGPARLLRQLLTESLVLAAIGGLAGLLVAWWGTLWLARASALQLPRIGDVGLDVTVFGFASLMCVGAGLLIGIVPAVAARRFDRHRALQIESAPSTAGRPLQRVRDTLVMVEIAGALVLSAGAGSLIRELVRLRTADLGMVPANVITFHVLAQSPGSGMAWRGSPPETLTRPFYEMANRVRSLPGVRAAGFTQVLPLQNWGWAANSIDFQVRGRPQAASLPFTFDLRYVTPGYFEALGVPLRRGRGFSDDDQPGTSPVVIINQTLARIAFGDADPIGQQTTRGIVVGVVADIRNATLHQETLPELYYPVAQNWSQLSELGMTLVVRTSGPPTSVVDAVRTSIRAVDPAAAIFEVKTMENIVEESMASFLLYLTLLGVFALVGIGLALIGTYGVMNDLATSRSREFAIRVALGANRAHITTIVVRHGLWLVASGVAAGSAVTLIARPLVRAVPFGITSPDIPLLAAVALLVFATAMTAVFLPARRISVQHPLKMLRNE